jgi:hypothetical protein
MFDNDEFDMPEELDPVDKIKMEEQYNEEIERSMRYAYDLIHKMGVIDWARLIQFSEEKKIRILENMITWHAHPDREEYEKAAELKRGLDTLKETK